jgi:hypothetical protein
LEQILKPILILLTTLTLSLSNLNAQTLKDFYIACGSADIGTSSETVYEIGYGVSKYFDSGFMWGRGTKRRND